MANAFGMIDESIWRRDREFRALPRGAQCTFLQLLSQRDVDTAGVLTLHVDLLAKGCDEITPEDIRHDLKTLEAARFVFVDDDTDELLIRSYVRRVTAKSPNALKSALKLSRTLASPKLRHVLAGELRRIGKADTTAVADEIDPGGTPSGRDSEPVADPIGTPSERGNPSGWGSEPPSYSSVTALVSPSVGGSVGEGPTQTANADTAPRPPANDPPPRYCPKHMPDGTDAPCGACGGHRQRRERWDAEHAADDIHAEDRRRISAQAAINGCRLCDPDGHIRMPDLLGDGEHYTTCPHDAAAIERARSEILEARKQVDA
ncbi:hypothetical protein AB0K45_09650 [Micrococcus luteus]|uniref:hypothetical protein n=1 Tax=Micrococcus luteus TaxID=1270 RepID=UPI0034187DD8